MRAHLLLTSLVIGLASCSGKSGKSGASKEAAPPAMQPQSVEVMTVEKMTLRDTINLTGTIAANESAELRAELAGTLTEILFEEGAPVKKGQPIARIDTRELEAQLAETKANFALAEKTLQRNQELLESGATSQLETDGAEAEHQRLQAAISLLEVRLAKSVIIAPFDGIAGARDLSVGDYVTPQSVITSIQDLSRLKVEIDVPERQLPKLRKGTTFTLSTAASGADAEIAGEVYFVPPVIDSATRSVRVKGYVTNPPEFVKPGMFANVTLVLAVVEDALVVPETAVLGTARGTVIIVPEEKDGGLFAAFVPVKTGLRIPGYVQITPVGPPVKAGDRFVSSGVGGLILFPGVPLKPVDPQVKPGIPADTDRKLD